MKEASRRQVRNILQLECERIEGWGTGVCVREPGGTSRQLTDSQLAFERDTFFPYLMPDLAEYRGQLEEFVPRGPEQAREANEDLFFVENSFKAYFGRQQALLDPQFFATKVEEEKKLRAATDADPKLAAMFRHGTTSRKFSSCASSCSCETWLGRPAVPRQVCLVMR